MMNRRQAMTIGLGVAAAVKFPMTARAAVKKAGDGVLRLGQTTALTGPNSAVGQQFRDAAQVDQALARHARPAEVQGGQLLEVGQLLQPLVRHPRRPQLEPHQTHEGL